MYLLPITARYRKLRLINLYVAVNIASTYKDSFGGWSLLAVVTVISISLFRSPVHPLVLLHQYCSECAALRGKSEFGFKVNF